MTSIHDSLPLFDKLLRTGKFVNSEVDGMEIMQAEESQVPEITVLWKELIDFHSTIDGFYARRGDAVSNFEKYLRDCMASEDSLVLAALEDGAVVGYSISTSAKHPPVIEIQSYGLVTDMAVKSEYRARGIGSNMLYEILHWYKSRGIGRIELHVAYANPIGYSFWTKHGFKDYERVLFKNL
jgi:ribosomal protein S18 acetylase RimI-like enzyme